MDIQDEKLHKFSDFLNAQSSQTVLLTAISLSGLLTLSPGRKTGDRNQKSFAAKVKVRVLQTESLQIPRSSSLIFKVRTYPKRLKCLNVNDTHSRGKSEEQRSKLENADTSKAVSWIHSWTAANQQLLA